MKKQSMNRGGFQKIIQNRKFRDNLSGYLFILPVFIFFMMFCGIPIFTTIFKYSYAQFNILGDFKWVGLDNFKELISDPMTKTIAWNGVKFLLILAPAQVICGLLFALGVHKTRNGVWKGILKTAIYFPSVVTTSAVAIAWGYMFNKDFGVINWVLRQLGIIEEGIPWLVSSKYAFAAILIFSIWKFTGTAFLYFIVGLGNVPESYYEAARIDGATERQVFFKITLPLITPSLFYVSLITIIWVAQCFDEPYFLTNGGPGDSTRTIAIYIYQKAFYSYNMGYASAIATVLFAVVFTLTIIQFVVQKKWVNYDYE